MGELKKLTPQELAELRVQLKMEQSSLTGEEEQEVLEETAKKITVKVARDKMTATIMLHEPEDETYSKDEIIEALQKNNVTTGYIEDALKRFKRQCARNGVLQEVRKREHYEKPSVKRKKKSEAARKRKF